jgi:hypothetical protein
MEEACDAIWAVAEIDEFLPGSISYVVLAARCPALSELYDKILDEEEPTIQSHRGNDFYPVKTWKRETKRANASAKRLRKIAEKATSAI